MVTNFLIEDQGVTAIEYALIASLIAIVIVGSVTSMGLSVEAMFNQLATAF